VYVRGNGPPEWEQVWKEWRPLGWGQKTTEATSRSEQLAGWKATKRLKRAAKRKNAESKEKELKG